MRGFDFVSKPVVQHTPSTGRTGLLGGTRSMAIAGKSQHSKQVDHKLDDNQANNKLL